MLKHQSYGPYAQTHILNTHTQAGVHHANSMYKGLVSYLQRNGTVDHTGATRFVVGAFL